MSYIGSTPTSQAFAPGTDTFSGDGTTVAFTLSRNVATVNDIQVVVNNVVQQPSNYTVASNILTFSPAPSSGTNNIYVRYLSTNLQTIAPQQGSVYPSSLSATGTPSSSTFYRGDNTWANPVSAGSIGISQLSATGTPSSSTFLRGDNTWSAISGTPAGVVMYFAANAAPTGYLKANGAAISRTTYLDLFTAIGTTFGAGDGSTTFNVPDLRGEFPRGWDDGRGVDSGRAFGSAQLATRIGTILDSRTTQTTTANTLGDTISNSILFYIMNSYQNTTTTQGYGVGARPTNVALLACIKF